MLARAWMLVCLAAPASAQDASVLVEEGLALRREGRDAEAAERFRAAFAIDGSARSLAQLALAEQAAGDWVAAERDLARAMAMDDPWIASHAEVLQNAMATIRSHVGRLTIESNVEGAEVWIDGERSGSLPLSEPLAVEVGTVVVELRAPGHVPAQRTATITAGRLSRLSIDLVARIGADPEPEAPRAAAPLVPPAEGAAPSGPSPLLLAGIASGAAAVVAVALTIAAVVVREDHVLLWNDDARCPPSADGGRLASCAGEHATFRTAEDYAIAGGVVTGALAVASAILLALGAGEVAVGTRSASLSFRY